MSGAHITIHKIWELKNILSLEAPSGFIRGLRGAALLLLLYNDYVFGAAHSEQRFAEMLL